MSLRPPSVLPPIAMSKLLASVLCAIALTSAALAAPAGSAAVSAGAVSASIIASSVLSAEPEQETTAHASDDPNGVLWNLTTTEDPQPIRGTLGAPIMAQQNVPLQQMNPDLLAPPTTDNGDM